MKLKRELGLLDVFCIASGAMISSGLFVLPGLAHAKAGPAVVISYFLAGLLAMAGMLSQAELVSAMPKAGGTYFYVTRSMGPAIGTVDGLLTWLSVSLKSSFALIGMAAFANLAVGMDMRLIAVLFCLFFLFINFIGIKEAGRIQVLIVMVL
ncbi:MAG: amino acid permease, partial [Candidatus Omnitrophota bacterium]